MPQPRLFDGISAWFTSTVPANVKQSFESNGGNVEKSADGDINVVIATKITEANVSKASKRGVRVVEPDWIVQSLRQKMLQNLGLFVVPSTHVATLHLEPNKKLPEILQTPLMLPGEPKVKPLSPGPSLSRQHDETVAEKDNDWIKSLQSSPEKSDFKSTAQLPLPENFKSRTPSPSKQNPSTTSPRKSPQPERGRSPEVRHSSRLASPEVRHSSRLASQKDPSSRKPSKEPSPAKSRKESPVKSRKPSPVKSPRTSTRKPREPSVDLMDRKRKDTSEPFQATKKVKKEGDMVETWETTVEEKDQIVNKVTYIKIRKSIVEAPQTEGDQKMLTYSDYKDELNDENFWNNVHEFTPNVNGYRVVKKI